MVQIYDNGQPSVRSLWFLFRMRVSHAWTRVTVWLRHVVDFVPRVIAYVPVLWRDADFDHRFLHQMMRYKLSRMAPNMSPRQARQIRLALVLLDRIIEDDYCAAEYTAHENQWGETIFDFVDGGELRIYTVISKVTMREEQERDAYATISHRAYKLRQRDLDRLYRVMRRYSETWWA